MFEEMGPRKIIFDWSNGGPDENIDVGNILITGDPPLDRLGSTGL